MSEKKRQWAKQCASEPAVRVSGYAAMPCAGSERDEMKARKRNNKNTLRSAIALRLWGHAAVLYGGVSVCLCVDCVESAYTDTQTADTQYTQNMIYNEQSW